MRKLAAACLLWWVGLLPAFAPAFAAVPGGKQVPACCRAGGAHHCMLARRAGSSHAWNSPPCGQWPGARAIAISVPLLAAQPALVPMTGTEPVGLPLRVLAGRAAVRRAASRAPPVSSQLAN